MPCACSRQKSARGSKRSSRQWRSTSPPRTHRPVRSSRHAEAIGRALESLRAAREAMLLGVTPDAVLTEAEEAMAAIGELTGASIREDITNRIFARFCVGK